MVDRRARASLKTHATNVFLGRLACSDGYSWRFEYMYHSSGYGASSIARQASRVGRSTRNVSVWSFEGETQRWVAPYQALSTYRDHKNHLEHRHLLMNPWSRARNLSVSSCFRKDSPGTRIRVSSPESELDLSTLVLLNVSSRSCWAC